jgi:hypothetical protein
MKVSTASIMFSLIILASVTMIVNAGLGEIAGDLNFNVSFGSTQSQSLTVFNTGSSPIAYEATLATISNVPNEPTPIITINPSNGILQAHQQQVINVTAYFPPHQRVDPGLNWTGLIEVNEISNTSSQSGGVLRVGVAKVISVTSASQEIRVIISSSPPTQQQNPFKIIYESVGAIVIIIVLIAIYYVYMRERENRRGH